MLFKYLHSKLYGYLRVYYLRVWTVEYAVVPQDQIRFVSRLKAGMRPRSVYVSFHKIIVQIKQIPVNETSVSSTALSKLFPLNSFNPEFLKFFNASGLVQTLEYAVVPLDQISFVFRLKAGSVYASFHRFIFQRKIDLSQSNQRFFQSFIQVSSQFI